MDRSCQSIVLWMAGLAFLRCAAVAEEGPAAVKRERVVSPHVAEMLTAAAPKFGGAAPVDPGAGTPAPAARPRLTAAEVTAPANTIIRLPDYLVVERKPKPLPKYEEVLAPRELEKLAMREFLGPEDGFDRGFLNLFTVADLWKKIPILGKFPLAGFETNEQRAMRMYRADRDAKAWSELMGLLTPAERVGIMTPTGSAPPKF